MPKNEIRFTISIPVRPQLFDLRSKLPPSLRTETLAGLTVALALVPEAVAFAFVAGVDPLVGLYAAFIMCLVTALLGGRPGMISGATGAMAVVVVSLVALHGVAYLFPAVILCGLIQIAVGLARQGKLIRMVPHPVMLGFVNGLAVVILLAQFGSFKTLGGDGGLHYLTGVPMAVMIALVGLTMAIIFFLPKLTKAVPSSLAAIVVVTLIAYAINAGGLAGHDGRQPVLTVKDMLVTNSQATAVSQAAMAKEAEAVEAVRQTVQKAGLTVVPDPAAEVRAAELSPDEVQAAIASVDLASVGVAGGLPRPFFLDHLLPPLTLETLWIILPFSLVLAGVGLIESLLTMTLIDELTATRGRGNRECIGQGVANVTCGLFGGMGGCAMIGQSLINVKSGGRGRLSGVVAALALLAFILVLAPLIEMVPMAALVGVMFMVVIGTFEWATLRTWRRVPLGEVMIMVFVAGYTVIMHDLASAVILGVVMSALMFAWKKSTHLVADTQFNEFGSKIYQLHGPLFFASVPSFRDLFDPAGDPQDVVIDFYFTRVYDQSGLEAINSLADRYAKHGKRLHLRHLSAECRQLLDRAGDLVEANISEDPHYHVATDKLG
jgi:SulP family sulfate permease